MDRFSSREDLDFISKEYAEGMLARSHGKGLNDNPYPMLKSSKDLRSNWASWNAGWADQDMIQLKGV